MRHLDLFSGIGGFALAARWVKWDTVGFCEKDKFCQKVLMKNFPGVPIISDIKEMDGTEFGTIDIISAGIPCQPFSCAGKQRGASDDRYLWPETFRVISVARPTWVCVENVTGIIKMELDNMLSDLEREGYSCQTLVIPACAVNAIHKRDRIWIIANADGKRCNNGSDYRSERPIQNDKKWNDSEDYSNREQHKFIIGEIGSVSSNADGERCQKRNITPCIENAGHSARRTIAAGASGEIEPGICRVDDGIPPWMARLMPDATISKETKIENYTNKLKAFGNAIVPQIAYYIFCAIDNL